MRTKILKYDNVINTSLVSGTKSAITLPEFWENKIIIDEKLYISIFQWIYKHKFHFVIAQTCKFWQLVNYIFQKGSWAWFYMSSVTPTICAREWQSFQLILHFNITLQNRCYIFIAHARNIVFTWICLVLVVWQKTETIPIIKLHLFICEIIKTQHKI